MVEWRRCGLQGRRRRVVEVVCPGIHSGVALLLCGLSGASDKQSKCVGRDASTEQRIFE